MGLASHSLPTPFSRIFVGTTKRIHYCLPNEHPGLTGKSPPSRFLITSTSNHPNIFIIFSFFFFFKCHDSSDHQVKSLRSASQQPGRAQKGERMALKVSYFKKLL